MKQLRSPRHSSITAVLCVDETCPSLELLRHLERTLIESFRDTEIVIIAAAPPDTVALALKHMVGTLPDISVHFLAHACDPDTQRLIGLDRALGDWVLCLTPTAAEIDSLAPLFSRIDEGYDVIVSESAPPPSERLSSYRFLERRFFGLLDRMVGSQINPGTSSVRLYSRAAALEIANSINGEILLRSNTLPGGFPTHTITGYSLRCHGHRVPSPRRSVTA